MNQNTAPRDRLFLLRPDFKDGDKGPYFCPGCAEVLGVIEFYPDLKQRLEIEYVDFPRPRPSIVALLGEENQSCPVIVLADAPTNLPSEIKVQTFRGKSFVEGASEIAQYLAHTHGIAKARKPYHRDGDTS